MTRTQQRYYLAIREFVAKRKYFPTLTELAKIMGIQSLSTVHKAVHILIDFGYIIKQGKSFELVPEKMHGLDNCSKGHPVVWFMGSQCPVCDVLARIPKAGVT